jgi:hypothetical protein
MPLETVKLTASFKLNGSIPEGLFLAGLGDPGSILSS